MEEIKLEILDDSNLNKEDEVKLQLRKDWTKKTNVKIDESLSKSFLISSSSFELKTNYNTSWTKIRLTIDRNRIICSDLILSEKMKFKNNSLLIQQEYPINLVILDFNLLTADYGLNKSKNEIKIVILGHELEVYLKASNSDIFNGFLPYINSAINDSYGSYYKLIGFCRLYHDFFKRHYISENDFSKTAKTGDIIVFRGYECSASCQRMLTGAEYDHAALIIRKGILLQVYESNSNGGVKLRYWSDFLTNCWVHHYEKIVYRKLEYDFPENQLEKIKEKIDEKMTDFITETKNKKYTISVKKILCNSLSYNEQSNYWKKTSGFFCSQLVAAALMNAEILISSRSSGNYLPGDFAHKEKLDFYPGFTYSNEIILDTTDYY